MQTSMPIYHYFPTSTHVYIIFNFLLNFIMKSKSNLLLPAEARVLEEPTHQEQQAPLP